MQDIILIMITELMLWYFIFGMKWKKTDSENLNPMKLSIALTSDQAHALQRVPRSTQRQQPER